MTTTLVIGGARSGKSRFVERRARERGGSVAFVATACPIDDEMERRIADHRATRPADWATVEEPLRLASALGSVTGSDVVVLDCLTVWLGNALHEGWDDRAVRAEVDGLVDWLCGTASEAYVVSNEVGLGIVPVGELSRRYRDLLGEVNSTVAEACDRTLFFAAGRAVELRDPEALG